MVLLLLNSKIVVSLLLQLRNQPYWSILPITIPNFSKTFQINKYRIYFDVSNNFLKLPNYPHWLVSPIIFEPTL